MPKSFLPWRSSQMGTEPISSVFINLAILATVSVGTQQTGSPVITSLHFFKRFSFMDDVTPLLLTPRIAAADNPHGSVGIPIPAEGRHSPTGRLPLASLCCQLRVLIMVTQQVMTRFLDWSLIQDLIWLPHVTRRNRAAR